MALEPRIRLLELAHWHLDQPLTGCGELSATETAIASSAKFTAWQRAMQTGFDRSVDLVVLHSAILSRQSLAGRAPWFLGRWIEASVNRSIPVVWAETTHNEWMQRHWAALPVTRLTPGESGVVATRSGRVRVVAGIDPGALQTDVAATIAITLGNEPKIQRAAAELVLGDCLGQVDPLDDWTAATRGGTLSIANLHTTRREGPPDREPLAVSPVGLLRVDCSLSSTLREEALASALFDEVESASARHLATHPGLELLVVDLAITGQGRAWETLADRDGRAKLRASIDRQRSLKTGPHSRWRLRAIHLSDAASDTTCQYTPIVTAIWNEATLRPSQGIQRMADLIPEAVSVDHWARTETVSHDHRLAGEAQRAAIAQLRAAG